MRTFLLLFCILLPLLEAAPEEQPASKLDLKELERRALEHSIQMRSSRIQKEIAKEKEMARFRDLFPSLSVSYRRNRTVARRDFDNGRHSIQLNLSQPIYDGGRSDLRLKKARLGRMMLKEQEKLLKKKILFQTRQLYVALNRATSELLLARETYRRSRALLRRSRLEYEEGMITELDYREIRNQTRRNSLSIQMRESELGSALQPLLVLTGVKADSIDRLLLLDAGSLQFNSIPSNRESLVKQAEKTHPEILQARLKLFQARRSFLVSKTYYLPTVSLTARYGKTGENWPPETNEWGIGINFTFRALNSTFSQDTGLNFSRGSTSRSIASGGQAQVLNDMERRSVHLRNAQNLIESRRKLRDLRKSLPAEARDILRKYEHKKKELGLLEQSRRIQKRRFRIDGIRYRRGAISLEEYREQELRYIQSSKESSESRMDLMLFAADLERKLGLHLDELNLIQLTYRSKEESSSILSEAAL